MAVFKESFSRASYLNKNLADCAAFARFTRHAECNFVSKRLSALCFSCCEDEPVACFG